MNEEMWKCDKGTDGVKLRIIRVRLELSRRDWIIVSVYAPRSERSEKE